MRPFNPREIELKSNLCIEMKNNTTKIMDENGDKKDFTFDYSFWSHDGFTTREDVLYVNSRDTLYKSLKGMLTNSACSIQSVEKYWITPSKATIAVYSLTDRLVLGNPTQ